MRTSSADEIKHNTLTHRLSDLPRRGSYNRLVYDLLKEYRGLPIRIPPPEGWEKSRTKKHQYRRIYGTIKYLTDMYGCDIRYLGNHEYMLSGEWIGSYFADYYMERVLEREKT